MIRLLTLIVLSCLLLTAPAHAQFVMYDDFASGAIDPEKWSGQSLEGTFSAPSEETVRVVENGQLRLKLVSWGNTSSDTGTSQTRQGLAIKQLGTLGGPGSITGLGANVTVLAAKAQNCPGNTTGASQARAQLFGFFFNDGTGGPTSSLGNISARIQLEKENDNTNRVVAFLARCTTADCSNAEFIAMPGNPVTFTTTWSLGAPLKLKLVWNEAGGRFKFTVADPGTALSETKTVVYAGTVTDAGPPTSADFKTVRLQNFVENCTAARKRTIMDAVFDDIQVQRQP